MYKNILVPVSFEAGRDAHDALEIAQVLRESNGTITILHVLEHLPQYASDLLSEDHVETARRAVTDKLTPLTETASDIEIAVIEGHSARGILDFAEGNDVNCIVITSHRPGVQDLILGSTAARVVRHAQCAVHIVR